MELETKSKDKTEISKQQIKEFQRILTDKIKPKKNHTCFEVDLISKEIRIAEFDEVPPLEWRKAVMGNVSLTKSVTTKPNCIYVLALNKANVIKILNKKNINLT
jgi:hypothetical protein